MALLKTRNRLTDCVRPPHATLPADARASGWPALNATGRPPARTAAHGQDDVAGLQHCYF
jgi:hypothetical protein